MEKIKELIQRVKCFFGFHDYISEVVTEETGSDYNKVTYRWRCRECGKYSPYPITITQFSESFIKKLQGLTDSNSAEDEQKK